MTSVRLAPRSSCQPSAPGWPSSSCKMSTGFPLPAFSSIRSASPTRTFSSVQRSRPSAALIYSPRPESRVARPSTGENPPFGVVFRSFVARGRSPSHADSKRRKTSARDGRVPLDVPRIDVKLGKALDQRAEGNLGLEARKRCTEAVVNADSEGEMFVEAASEVQSVGLEKPLR